MKYSIKIIILLCVVLSSCKKDNSYSTYKIQNSSNYIIHFDVDSHGTVESYDLKNGESHLWTVPEGEGSTGWCVSKADSVRIYFDNYNSNMITYYNYWLVSDSTFNLKRNPINTAFYSKECIRTDGCDYTYVITEDDYENAAIKPNN